MAIGVRTANLFCGDTRRIHLLLVLDENELAGAAAASAFIGTGEGTQTSAGGGSDRPSCRGRDEDREPGCE